MVDDSLCGWCCVVDDRCSGLCGGIGWCSGVVYLVGVVVDGVVCLVWW